VLGVHSLVVGALGLGIAFSLALPMQTAMVPTLVDPADTEAGMAMNSVSYNAGRALAPALCVPILAFIGPGWIFMLNAVSFVIFAVVLGCLKFGARQIPSPDHLATEHARRRARVMDGVRAARRYRRILLLLTVVAAVTLADDPILVLSPGLARSHLHVSSDWAGYFIAALGWGTVAGSLWPTSRQKCVNPSHASRRVAWLLLALAGSVILFTLGVSAPVSLFAALAVGVAALFTGATAQSLIIARHHKNAASIAGLWAIAWAGTKPIASLLDGWLAVHVGIVLTGIDLVLPAVILALCEIGLSKESKQAIKNWSLTGYLERHPHLKRVLSSLSDRLSWEPHAEEGRDGVGANPLGG
jgi:MFS family permease